MVVNSDPIFHSVHLYGFLNRNLALGPNQSKTIRTVSRPGYYIVKCDVHGWMGATIAVVDNPYAVVTGADGSFSLADVPAGTYTVEVWHGELRTQTQTVTVDAGGTATVEVEFN